MWELEPKHLRKPFGNSREILLIILDSEEFPSLPSLDLFSVSDLADRTGMNNSKWPYHSVNIAAMRKNSNQQLWKNNDATTLFIANLPVS